MKIEKLRGFEENDQNVPLIDNIKNWITYSYIIRSKMSLIMKPILLI